MSDTVKFVYGHLLQLCLSQVNAGKASQQKNQIDLTRQVVFKPENDLVIGIVPADLGKLSNYFCLIRIFLPHPITELSR